jgi:signal transduction histidine kinase
VARNENLLTEINRIDGRYLNPDIIEDCRSILDEVIKLSYSAENLRDWMAEEKDIYDFDLSQSVNIYTVIREAIDLFRNEAFFRGILIDGPRSMDMAFPHISGSKPHLRKVFANLLNNAVKYSFDGTPEFKRHIEIICRPIFRQKGTYYCIEVSNHGVGVLPDELEKVFEFGYRGKMARDRNRFGSGLGLPAVKKIVERHNGDITLDSVLDGESFDGSKLNPYKTTIKIFLPL